ncbi:MAG: AI-2E family transporter [Alphaproteobacteria bacterium]|nr:AI-2E family transporter [Alphaproteobacteria bacterium]
MTKTSNKIFWFALAAALLFFIALVHTILLPFVLGMGTAYFLDPAADRLQRFGLSRGVATLLITTVFFSLIVLLLVIATPIVAAQVNEMMESIPGYAAQIERDIIPALERKLRMLSPALVEEVKTTVTNSSWMVARAVAEFFGNALTSGVAFINILSLVLITPIVAFYLLRDWDYITRHVNALIPDRYKPVVHEQFRLINLTLSGFVRGQLNVCLLLGLYYAILLSLIGLNSGFIIGLATGFLVIFPYVGLLVGMLVGLTVAFFQFDGWMPVALVLAVFVSGQVIEGNFVTPKLVGDKVGLHPVWIIFAMLAGAAIFGFLGVLLAVPTAAVLGVLIRFAIGRYQESSYFK